MQIFSSIPSGDFFFLVLFLYSIEAFSFKFIFGFWGRTQLYSGLISGSPFMDYSLQGLEDGMDARDLIQVCCVRGKHPTHHTIFYAQSFSLMAFHLFIFAFRFLAQSCCFIEEFS